MIDYYKLLGVDYKASTATIRKAFKNKMRITLPVRKENIARTVNLVAAYTTLFNTDARKAYDNQLERKQLTSNIPANSALLATSTTFSIPSTYSALYTTKDGEIFVKLNLLGLPNDGREELMAKVCAENNSDDLKNTKDIFVDQFELDGSKFKSIGFNNANFDDHLVLNDENLSGSLATVVIFDLDKEENLNTAFAYLKTFMAEQKIKYPDMQIYAVGLYTNESDKIFPAEIEQYFVKNNISFAFFDRNYACFKSFLEGTALEVYEYLISERYINSILSELDFSTITADPTSIAYGGWFDSGRALNSAAQQLAINTMPTSSKNILKPS